DDPARARPLTGEEMRGERGGGAAGPRLAIPDRLDASLVLRRHGESELIVQRRFQGRLDTPLSATGRRQAERVAARLARPHDPPALPVPEGGPLAIVHSPLARAADTAPASGRASAAGASVKTAPPRPDERFIEIGQGDWEGRLASEIAADDGERLTAGRNRPIR